MAADDRFRQLKQLTQLRKLAFVFGAQLTEKVVDEFSKGARARFDERFRADIRAAIQHPRSIATWLESYSPWIQRRFLGVASNILEPFTLGMGFQVQKLGEDVIEVLLPDSVRNRGEGRAVHTAALSALGELSPRLFWEHHIDLRANQADSNRVQTRILARPKGEMRAVFRLPVADREAILHKLRAENRATVETQTQIYDADGRLVAEVDVDWELGRRLLLGAKGKTNADID